MSRVCIICGLKEETRRAIEIQITEYQHGYRRVADRYKLTAASAVYRHIQHLRQTREAESRIARSTPAQAETILVLDGANLHVMAEYKNTGPGVVAGLVTEIHVIYESRRPFAPRPDEPHIPPPDLGLVESKLPEEIEETFLP